MGRGNGGGEAIARDVGVDLRRSDVGVSKQGLHAAKIGTALHQMGGEGMSQYVRRQFVGIETGSHRQFFQHLVQTAPRQVAFGTA
jgi:hypothetical protein